ncbi:10 kDa heat shock protein, mitochondrial-like [Phyllostomus discolor]|uniref:10 kDa heat shock protein, mitochondrial n=1 Tax=Phyllostomus discolor TaxID=89673 RepID=A0A7E6D221_9CHIR|nr:10 kDa heat shock protein, mitochondrial-like [Phyllostomus discolor]
MGSSTIHCFKKDIFHLLVVATVASAEPAGQIWACSPLWWGEVRVGRTFLCTRQPFPKFTCPAGWTASLSLQPQFKSVVRQAFRKFLLLVDQVLVEKNIVETVTKGGIMLPEKSQGKVLQATIIAVDLGSKGRGGEIQPVRVEVGDKVLPEYGGIQVVLDDKGYVLLRDGNILGKYVD